SRLPWSSSGEPAGGGELANRPLIPRARWPWRPRGKDVVCISPRCCDNVPNTGLEESGPAMLKVHGPARARRTRPAAAAAELAFLLPVLVLLTVACADFARLFYFYVTVTNCARNGAIWASDPVAKTTSPYTTLDQAVGADSSGLSLQPATSKTGTDANG